MQPALEAVLSKHCGDAKQRILACLRGSLEHEVNEAFETVVAVELAARMSLEYPQRAPDFAALHHSLGENWFLS